MKKVILISIDGMRADGVEACGNPFVDEMKRLGSYTLTVQTVLPSVTLPCHMSCSIPCRRPVTALRPICIFPLRVR